jgi:glutamate-5-semialdehyde dehydrogenase
MDHDTTATALAARAKAASTSTSTATTAQKNDALARIAAALTSPATIAHVLAENARDLDAAQTSGLKAELVDRLRLDAKRLASLANAVKEIEALDDPVGSIAGLVTRPSGIQVGRMRVPLGVILMIYESRPNVTVDAAALCLKAGNACILRGGKEALHTNRALAKVVVDAVAAAGLDEDAVVFVDDTDKELLYALLRQSQAIDLAIPRGGTALIDAVNAHARIPVIQHYQGICHVYVHEAADVDVAVRVVVNAKVSRPGVCNAAECVIVDRAIAPRALPAIVQALRAHNVDVVGDAAVRAVVDVAAAVAADFDTEFLSLKMAIAIVDDERAAHAFIARHGTRHTASIITRDHDTAMRFVRGVDASCVVVNASTRFNDGGELGLGAELGISTTKLHAYGPMGLVELCTQKFVVFGHGETRGSPP